MTEEKAKKSWYKRWWAILLFVFVGLMILGAMFGGNDSSYQSGNNNLPSETEEDLTILNHELSYTDFGGTAVLGTAENTAGRMLSYAQVDVKFYDTDGAVIGNSLDNINDLGSGEKWKFEAVYLGTDGYNVDSYAISVGPNW